MSRAPRSRPPRVLAALAALTLLVAACGDDDDATEATEPAVETVASTEPATTEPATTEPTTTEAPTTEPDTTEAPTTEPDTTEPAEPALGSIVDVATEAGEFTTLLAAAEAAGLTEQLATREITLLAPTDAAFEALGQATIDALLADPATLRTILEGHVLPVPQESSAIVRFTNVLAINSASWDVVVNGDVVTIGGATVITADVPADNGVIHVIDAVLVPPPTTGG